MIFSVVEINLIEEACKASQLPFNQFCTQYGFSSHRLVKMKSGVTEVEEPLRFYLKLIIQHPYAVKTYIDIVRVSRSINNRNLVVTSEDIDRLFTYIQCDENAKKVFSKNQQLNQVSDSLWVNDFVDMLKNFPEPLSTLRSIIVKRYR